MESKMNIKNPIVIIGAGLSGLRAASLLTAQGIPCRILEARGRVGGRVLSQTVPERPELGTFDLGPTWFWPQHEPVISELVEELGLETFMQYSQGTMMAERDQTEAPQRYVLPAGAIAPSARFVGGVQSLIDALAATLPHGAIELNQRVTAIRQQELGDLTLEVEGSASPIHAHAVLIAIPPRIAARNITFVPELPPETKASLLAKPTWMAGQAKVVAVYERPFWREQGLSGLATSWAGPLQEIHDASPPTGGGALFGFCGMPATQRAQLGVEALLKLVEAQLIRLFGPLAGHKVALLYKDWSDDRDTAIAEDAEPLREFPVYGPPEETDDWTRPILFAGTEVARDQGGHLEGALQAADRAVDQLVKRYLLKS